MGTSTIQILKKLLPIIGISLFVYIISTLDIEKLQIVLSKCNVSFLVVGMFIIALAVFVRCIRSYIVMRSQNIQIDFIDSALVYLKSVFWGLATPGRLGEISRIAYLKNYSSPGEKSLANIVIDRILDVICISLCCLVSLVFVEVPGKKDLFLLGAGGFALGGLILLVLFKLTSRSREDTASRVVRFLRELLHIRNKVLLMAVSLGNWAVYYGGMVVLGMSIGLDTSPLFLVFCAAASNLVAILPVSIAGIGTRDALLVYLFPFASLTEEEAVVFSGFFILAYLLVMALAYGSIVFGGRSKRGEAPSQ